MRSIPTHRSPHSGSLRLRFGGGGDDAGGPALAGTQAAAQGPVVKLIAAQNSITLTSSRGPVYLDRGVYAASLGSALQFDVQRASYTKPITLAQVIYRSDGGTTTRFLPGSLLDGFNGLRDFLRLSVADTAGKVVASFRPVFCFNGNPQRAVSGSAREPAPGRMRERPVPEEPGHGPAEGWAADPAGFSSTFPPPDRAAGSRDLQGERDHRPAVGAPAARHRRRRDRQRQAHRGEGTVMLRRGRGQHRTGPESALAGDKVAPIGP
jgi:hypothetical protein